MPPLLIKTEVATRMLTVRFKNAVSIEPTAFLAFFFFKDLFAPKLLSNLLLQDFRSFDNYLFQSIFQLISKQGVFAHCNPFWC